jgi:hypothetical protein
VNSEEEYIQDILRRLSRKFQGRLIFAGIIDENAKLVHFQKGNVAFRLPTDRQAALDVQVSLLLQLAKQFEDFAASLTQLVMTFNECEIVIMKILNDSVLYVICRRGAASDISNMLAKFVEDGPEKGLQPTNHEQRSFIEDEWSGQ